VTIANGALEGGEFQCQGRDDGAKHYRPPRCTHSLQITVPPKAGGWFGPAYNTPPLPFPLAGVHQILMDITTTNSGTSQAVAVQVGSDYHWCQTNFGFINSATSATVTVDMASLLSSTSACGGSLPKDTSVLQGM
jgi:hypothetical protein